MSEFQPFLMERMMSKFEQNVDYNLSESGVHPISLKELLADDPGQLDRLLESDLNYPHVEGIPELRERIAALYKGAAAGNVLVTVGAAEANFITTNTLLSRGEELAIMLPNYMQIWGIAKNEEYAVSEFHLREDDGWALDLSELSRAVTDKTRLIAVCNPDNPTGHILTETEMDAIVAVAERSGAWILSDEVYRGAERLGDDETASFYGRYDKVIAIGSLSKAYGLPGLRIGWLVGPPDTVDEIWARHEYTTLAATMLSNKLASIALLPGVRERLLRRGRGYIRNGYPVLDQWIRDAGGTFTLTPPQASAISFVRYNVEINSTDLTEKLRTEKSVLIVPGDHFALDRHVRISFALPHDYLLPALQRIHDLIIELGD